MDPAPASSAVEDDDTLQEQFAALLANAADPREEYDVVAEFVEVLGHLTSRDALFLNAVLESATARANMNAKSRGGGFRANEMAFDRKGLLELYVEAGLAKALLSKLAG
jgi:hypothetical protein